MSNIAPAGWFLKPLSALADYHNGRAFKPEDWSTNGLPILRIAQINEPNKETDYYDGTDILEKHLIKRGDLIFSWSATLKAVIWKHYDAVLNQHIFKVIERPEVSRLYLQQALEDSMDKLAESSHGSTMKHIKKGVLDEFQLAVPPLIEQKKIASILISVDEVIENTQKQIDKLQDLKKATMNELLTKGIGHTEFKDSELGRVPKSWAIKKLGDVGICVRGLTYSPDDISHTGLLVLRSSNIQSGRISLHDNVFVDVDVQSHFKARKGDILICVRNGSRALLGKSALIDEHIPNATHGAFMTIFRSASYAFIRYLFESDLFFSQVSRDIGATINSINNSNLLQYKFAFPNVDEQIRIAEVLQRIDSNIDHNIMKLNHSMSLKKSLMQDLLTGKKRVEVK